MYEALVLFSGGIDSSTALYWSKSRYKTLALTINYNSRPEGEIDSARKIVQYANLELLEIDAKFIKEAFHFYNKFEEDIRWPFYIASKNLLFYAIAAHYAEYMKIRLIVGGHNSEDTKFYTDATKEYIKLLNMLLKKGSMLYNEYEIVTPLVNLTKIGVIKLARELDLPLELTWSCHMNGKIHCGICYGCKSRRDAFNRLYIKDKTTYER